LVKSSFLYINGSKRPFSPDCRARNRYVSLGLPDVFLLCPEPVLANDCFSEEETGATKSRFSRTKIAVFRGADGAIPRRVSNASDAPAKNASRSLNLSSYVCPKPVLVK
jgi:hypothetical protein